MNKRFLVLDTNIFVSANLLESSTSAQALDKALRSFRIAVSKQILAEYTEVIYRKKLDRYLSNTKREVILKTFTKNAVFFHPTEIINACRDEKDNIFLEPAIASEAFCILSGDSDLLMLNPFRNIPILSPADFLEWA